MEITGDVGFTILNEEVRLQVFAAFRDPERLKKANRKKANRGWKRPGNLEPSSTSKDIVGPSVIKAIKVEREEAGEEEELKGFLERYRQLTPDKQVGSM